MPILILASLPFVFTLAFKYGINLYTFLILLIIYTAPLERIRWDVGFALRPVMIISLILFYLLIIKYSLQREIINLETRKLLSVLLILIFIFVFSLLITIDPHKGMRVIILYITLFLLFFLIVQEIKNKERLCYFLKHYMFIGLLLSLFGLAQFVGYFFRFDPDALLFKGIEPSSFKIPLGPLKALSYRINSLFNDSNNFAGYLNSVFPLFLAGMFNYFKFKSKKQLLIFGLSAFFVGLALFLTLSRSGWMGMFFGLLTLLIDRRRQIFNRRNLKYLIGISLILFFLIYPFLNILTYTVELRLEEKNSKGIHIYVAKSAWSMFLNNPLLGVGIGNFGEHYGRYYRPGHEYYNPHSAFLAILSEVGLIGFLFYMLFYYYVLKQILIFKKRGKGTEYEYLGSGLLAGFVGLMVANIFYQNYTFQFFYVFLAIAFASGNTLGEK